jgi:peptidoglycan/LPS O-acetylase OafA/YrhL
VELEGRIRHIDGCRALAVLGVILFHAMFHASWAQSAIDRGGTEGLIVTILSQGVHGVDLFFVISGFCLSYPTLAALRRKSEASFQLDRFFAKRLVRIIPPYYAAVLSCIVAIAVFELTRTHIPNGLNPNQSWADVLFQALFWDRPARLATPSFWTLSVEFRWYLLFPFLLTLWVRTPRAYFLLLFALVVAYNWTRARSIDMGVLPAFMLGIVAADWQILEHPIRKYAPILTAAALDIALLLEPFSSTPLPDGSEKHGFYTPGNIGWHFTCFFFLLSAGAWTPLRSILAWRPLAFIGGASYSIYLVQQPILSFFDENLVGALGALPACALGSAAAVLAGIVFWYLIERSFCHGSPIYARLIPVLQAKIGTLLQTAGIPRDFRL